MHLIFKYMTSQKLYLDPIERKTRGHPDMNYDSIKCIYIFYLSLSQTHLCIKSLPCASQPASYHHKTLKTRYDFQAKVNCS